ncbi:hypothetical protein PR202_gb13736 [Eleusine coracana subsp. coracana]|uniref:Peptidase A1 domain-containing protein n=1 Tax=Eleusine coracana subsp. coracana TaxID=191504 RepID=A0AAV5ETC9_ELECO|nr:hypothetical protein PR202_gb13736 [Eleusine coracana subsp. coracana]
MVASIKIPIPRLPNLSPKIPKQVGKFFGDRASDLPNFVPSGGSSPPSNGEPSDGGGRSQAAATNASSYYSFNFTVGDSDNPQLFSGMIDINSDLVWMQCNWGTIFYPSQSPTIVPNSCMDSTCQSFVKQRCSTDANDDTRCYYTYMYNGGLANTTGYLVTDTAFTFSTDPVPLVVGCGFYNVGDFGGAAGVIGLGRGPLSLVSQLPAGRFSYYFAPDNDDGDSSTAVESFIHFGDDATPMTSRATSTPLLASIKDGYASSYYVGLTGIQVDGEDIPIPTGTFDLDQTDGSGGVILSITVPVTFLHEGAYYQLKNALSSKIGLTPIDGSALGLDLCYSSRFLTMTNIPAMALVFDGGNNNNVVMELQTRNYFYMDSDTGLECLTILPSPSKASLLGSLIQTGTHMIYDVRGNKLQFESLSQASPTRSDSSNNRSPPLFLSSLLVVVSMLYWIVAA